MTKQQYEQLSGGAGMEIFQVIEEDGSPVKRLQHFVGRKLIKEEGDYDSTDFNGVGGIYYDGENFSVSELRVPVPINETVDEFNKRCLAT